VDTGFRKRSCSNKKVERDDDSKKSHPVLASNRMVLALDLLALYAVIGAITAVAFVTVGLARVLPPGTPVTVGARVLFLPGAALLWPYVLARWVNAGGAR
jgi:hypothetical protein